MDGIEYVPVIDTLVDDYYMASWKTSLLFPKCVLCPLSNTYEEFQMEATKIDIFQYTSKDAFKNWIIRFDPQSYKVDNSICDKFAKSTDGSKLVQEIMKLLTESGQGLYVSNGAKSSKNRFIERDICCSRYKLYQKRVSNDTEAYNDIRLRKGSKKITTTTSSKCTSTSLPLITDEKCTCRIAIHVDHNSYYVRCGYGNATHCFHPKLNTNHIVSRTKHLQSDCVSTINEFGYCKASAGSAMIAASVRHNVTLSRRQCATIMRSEHLKKAFEEVLESESSTWTAPEEMYSIFKKKKILFGMLYHSKDAIDSEIPGFEARQKKRRLASKEASRRLPKNDENVSPNAMNVLPECNNGVCVFETFIPDNTTTISIPKIIDDPCPVDFANNCRVASEATDDQDVVLALIWSMPHCRQLFQAFPEVLFVDGTHKTNNEKYPLFTAGIRDENFNVVIILRAFCPNERGWMFEWLFKEAIPAVLGADACKRVRTIVTDGDSQETTELDAAIALGIYGGATRRRCGWHIVHQGCKNILFRRFLIGADKTDETVKVVENVKVWILSIMKEVENRNEFETSKALLLQYLNSENVINRIGRRNAFAIINFLRDHVFKHEDFFVAYKYSYARSFGDYSNTPLEGTNGGLKYGTFAVKPNMKLSKSTSHMVTQDETKYADMLRRAYSNFAKTKLYFRDEGAESKRIVPKAFGEMKIQMDIARSYCSIMLDEVNWIVQFAKEPSERTKVQLLPHFLRFRHVRRDELGGFHCTCPFSASYGIPCRHIIHVVQSYGAKKYVFSHHDVDVRWWTTYATLVALEDPKTLNTSERTIVNELIRIRSGSLCIGKYVVMCHFDGQKYMCGSDADEQFSQLQLSQAKNQIFVNTQVSRPTNYDCTLVEAATSSLNKVYNGLKWRIQKHVR